MNSINERTTDAVAFVEVVETSTRLRDTQRVDVTAFIVDITA